ncbi:NUDIX domain-containing protein [Uniformispora flossi]|uniref:NUDIX domain-containing protein n=1 Tax=Uniformispora flossi TaxID=3390723 RepID=UPI003C302DCA
MPKQSAGILLHRMRDGVVEVLLVHPGGPFWARRDAGAWSIPKGEYTGGEAPLDAAVREFREETGAEVDPALAVPLGSVTQRGGKVVTAWAVAGDFDVAELVSNLVEVEWPRGSGAVRSFPEVDRAEWCGPDEARRKLLAAQAEFVDRLMEILRTES